MRYSCCARRPFRRHLHSRILHVSIPPSRGVMLMVSHVIVPMVVGNTGRLRHHHRLILPIPTEIRRHHAIHLHLNRPPPPPNPMVILASPPTPAFFDAPLRRRQVLVVPARHREPRLLEGGRREIHVDLVEVAAVRCIELVVDDVGGFGVLEVAADFLELLELLLQLLDFVLDLVAGSAPGLPVVVDGHGAVHLPVGEDYAFGGGS